MDCLFTWVHFKLSPVGEDTNRGVRRGRCPHRPQIACYCDNIKYTLLHLHIAGYYLFINETDFLATCTARFWNNDGYTVKQNRGQRYCLK